MGTRGHLELYRLEERQFHWNRNVEIFRHENVVRSDHKGMFAKGVICSSNCDKYQMQAESGEDLDR